MISVGDNLAGKIISVVCQKYTKACKVSVTCSHLTMNKKAGINILGILSAGLFIFDDTDNCLSVK
jgi:hypothetical protein